MTALTVVEVAQEDFPTSLLSGTSKKRVKMFVRGTASGGASIDLATYNPNIADVEGVVYYTDNGAALAETGITWSTSTLTIATTAGAVEVCVIATLN